jgi:glucose/arabinose dehydrogenase
VSFWRTSVVLGGIAALLFLSGSAGAVTPTLQLVQAGSGFSSPVSLASTSADPNAIYVVEQGGRVRRVVGGVTDPKPFLDISRNVRMVGEQGLLSLVFSPTYATDHTFYAYYVSKKSAVTVSQFVPKKTKIKGKDGKDGGGGKGGGGVSSKSPFKETVLLTVNHSKFDNHNGGQLAFGPDGKLYAGIGDGGGGGDPLHSGQNPTSNLGKLLRAAGPTFKTWQIAGFGLRNPWRYSFDSLTGDLYIGDVGQGNREEVDHRTAVDLATPANYGWNRYEGTADYDTSTILNPPASSTPLVFPVQEYDHSNGDCAIIGGYVYRGSAMAGVAGRYFYADLCSGRVWSMAAVGGDNRLESVAVNTPSSFGTDSAGELYVVALGDGKVYRLAD